jgi:hypothetical protein
MKSWCCFVAGMMLAGTVLAQWEEPSELVLFDNLLLIPSVGVLGAYDSRVATDERRKNAESDLYGEAEVAAVLKNRGGAYVFNARGLYAQRYYSDYTELSDNRYNLGAGLGAEGEALSWNLGADARKTLNYETTVDTSTGQGPGSVLSDEVRNIYTFNAGAEYAGYISDKTELTPSYEYRYRYEDPEESESTRWQEHNVGLELASRHTDVTTLTLTGSYSYQIDEEENGHVVRLLVGARGRITDLTKWTAQIGLAGARYDESGTDQAVIGNMRGIWQASEKVSAYLFGGNDYQPGYNGSGARMLYRLGYGTQWAMRERWSSGLQVLHSYQKAVGRSTNSYSEKVFSFINANLHHKMANRLAADMNFRYVHDDYEEDKVVVSIGISKKY